jgi:hypothetical protein
MKLRAGGHSAASLETKFLRQDHTAAVRELRDHKSRCIPCERATRKRTGGHCAEGKRLIQAEADLKTQVQESAKLDAAPIPGQETLFSEDECRP